MQAPIISLQVERKTINYLYVYINDSELKAAHILNSDVLSSHLSVTGLDVGALAFRLD